MMRLSSVRVWPRKPISNICPIFTSSGGSGTGKLECNRSSGGRLWGAPAASKWLRRAAVRTRDAATDEAAVAEVRVADGAAQPASEEIRVSPPAWRKNPLRDRRKFTSLTISEKFWWIG